MAAQLYDEETIQAFHREAACLADQYSNYSIADSIVDGNLTLGENLADHGGLRMALAAYTQWRQDHVDYRWSTIYKNDNNKNTPIFVQYNQIPLGQLHGTMRGSKNQKHVCDPDM